MAINWNKTPIELLIDLFKKQGSPQGAIPNPANNPVAGAQNGVQAGLPLTQQGIGGFPGTTNVGSISKKPDETIWGGEEPGSILFQQYFPYQQQGIQSALGMALQGLQNNSLDFGPIEAQARKGFQEQTLPSILERFNALGGERSSAFPQILGSAAQGLESDIAAQKSQYGLAQNELLQRLLGIGLAPQIESVYSQGKPGLAASIGPFVGAAVGKYFGM